MNCRQLARFATTYPPATVAAIQAAAAAIGYPFPSEYVALLRCSDGLEPQTERYSISVFSTSDLPDMNRAYGVQDELPAFLCIGLDGGGRGIFLSCTDTPGAVYVCGMGALAPEELRQIAPDLSSWISVGFALNDPPPSRHPRAIDVYLVSKPSGGLKSVYRLAQTLNLAIPVSELRRILDHLPYRLLHAVPYLPYAWKCAEINASESCLVAYEADTIEQPIVLQTLQ